MSQQPVRWTGAVPATKQEQRVVLRAMDASPQRDLGHIIARSSLRSCRTIEVLDRMVAAGTVEVLPAMRYQVRA